jgi:DNA-binding CsgD family transcriptional regulator
MLRRRYGGTVSREKHVRAEQSEDSCAAGQSIRLANSGINRAAVLQLADAVLRSETCGGDVDCAWAALRALIYADNLIAANEYCRRLSRKPRWVKSERHQHTLLLAQARIRMFSGRSAEAAALLESLLTRKVDSPLNGLVIAWLVETLVHLGEIDRAQGILFDQDLLGPIDTDFPARAHVLAARAASHIAAGQFSHGIDDYRACGRVLTATDVCNPAVVPWRSRAALGAIAIHRFDLAVALAEEELAAARRWGAPRTVGCALHALAIARRGDESIALLEQAVELFDLAQTHTELMQALYDVSALHVERNDVAAGRSKLEAVDAVARVSGNSFWLRRAKVAMQRLESPGESIRLTRQELKAAQLARAGYSNRQIAQTLCLQIRTVEFHLSSAYRKLGISGRRELVGALSVAAS